jgi:hypothetical protein
MPIDTLYFVIKFVLRQSRGLFLRSVGEAQNCIMGAPAWQGRRGRRGRLAGQFLTITTVPTTNFHFTEASRSPPTRDLSCGSPSPRTEFCAMRDHASSRR